MLLCREVLSENDERRLRAVENAVLAMNDIAAEIATQQKRLPELIAGSFVAGVERVAGDDVGGFRRDGARVE